MLPAEMGLLQATHFVLSLSLCAHNLILKIELIKNYRNDPHQPTPDSLFNINLQ